MRPSRLSQKGFQLAELLVCVTIFSLVGGLCFYAAASGFRLFAQTTSRQALQRDARAIIAWLQRDLGLSNLMRCHTVARDEGAHRRDGLAVVALDSWQEPLPLDALSLPAWNRIVVYAATRGPKGLLMRQQYLPNAPPPLTAQDVRDTLGPALGGTLNPLEQRRLSGAVQSFSVELVERSNAARIDLTLREETVEGGSGQAREEVLQVQTTITPRNTWPRL